MIHFWRLRGFLHDLNNQLTIIGCYAEIGASSAAREHAGETSRYFSHISEATRIANQLSVRMRDLAFSTVPAADLDGEDDPCACDVNAIIARHASGLADLPGWTVCTQLAGDIPLACIQSLAFERTLINLTQNARDAMMSAGSSPAMISIASAGAGGRVLVRVTDSGPGIESDTLDMLRTCKSTTTKSGDGHGIGLSRVVWQTLIRCGGDMEIESTPGHGSEFTLFLPAAR